MGTRRSAHEVLIPAYGYPLQVDIRSCRAIIDLDTPDATALEPRYADSPEWEVCPPFANRPRALRCLVSPASVSVCLSPLTHIKLDLQRLFCRPFLDPAHSHPLFRAFHIPILGADRVKMLDYCLLVRTKQQPEQSSAH